MPHLNGKNVVLGVTGSIAAYKAVLLARLLREEGASVRVCATQNGLRFVGAPTFHGLTGHPVATQLWEGSEQGTGEPHIDLAAWADLIVVYPATQAFIGRVAACMGTDLLSLTVLAARCPVVVAPAMHTAMVEHPLFEDAQARLRSAGIVVMPTAFGRLASGEEGPGRLPEPEEVIEWIAGRLAPKDLGGVSVLVTAGGTREPLDAVRFLGNPSTGKMGIAVAKMAVRRGARVTLIHGPGVQPPQILMEEVVRVRTAEEMAMHVHQRYKTCDVLAMSAAVADFRPVNPRADKISKADGIPTIELERTEDILSATSSIEGKRVRVGFAMGTTEVFEVAPKKLEAKKLDLIVANAIDEPGAGFANATNRVDVFAKDGQRQSWPLMSKDEVADRILDCVARLRAGDKALGDDT